MANQGTKRKRDHRLSDSSTPLKSDIGPRMKAKQIMQGINVEVENTKSTSDGMTALHNYILENISRMEKAKKKATIVILGRTGEGKSSLLNAIMKKENLLPSGCFGACTSVITQVEANLHDSNYIAEIEFISEEEWKTQIASLDKTDETFQDMMTALFGADAEDKTFEELKEKAKYAKLERLLSTKKIISERSNSTFVNELTCYIQHSDNGDCYWPFVKSMTIKIPKCRELLEHIVLVDLPGTEDCNKIRDNLWKSKLRECSAVWVVSDIKRAKSDRNPWAILEHCIDELGPGGECKHINFICTKTDEIKPAEYLRSERLAKKDILGGHQDLKKQCTLHRNKRAKDAVNKKLKNESCKESKERFITDVFTVSSTAYFDRESHLKPTETEIPRLQNVLRSLNNSINQKLNRDYINDAKGILSLIQSFQRDKDKKMTKKGVQIQKLEKSLEKKLKILDGQFESLYSILEQCLSKGVEESVRSFVKTRRGIILPVRPENNKLHYNTYQAMCRKNGYHWPKNWNEPIDLNKYLTKHMYESINEKFELIFPVDDNDKKGKSMQDYLDKFSIFQRVSPSAPLQYPFENFIKTQETNLKELLSTNIIETKKEIYSSIYTTIQNKMTPGYKKAAEVRGGGCLMKMEKIITNKIEELKPQMFNEAKAEVLKMFKNLKLQIMTTLESELKRSVEHLLSQTSETTMFDVSKEIQELEGLSQHLSN